MSPPTVHLIVDSEIACGDTVGGAVPQSMFRDVNCDGCRDSSLYELAVAIDYLERYGTEARPISSLTVDEAMSLIKHYSKVRMSTIETLLGL